MRVGHRSFVAGIIASLLFGATSALSQASNPAPPKLIHHTVPVDGHAIAVWEKSAGSPRHTLLLVHGRTWSSIPDFDLHAQGENLSVMDAFAARGYDVYAIDLRGYGATPRDPSGWLTPSRAADDVFAVLDWIRKRSAINEGRGTRGEGRGQREDNPALIGWSRGSMVAQLAAERHPGAMSALVLFARPMRDSAFPRDSTMTAAPRRPNTAIAAASDFITPGSIRKTAVDAYVRQALTSDPILAEWRRLDEFDSLDATRVTVPTLLIIGELDPFYAREKAKQAELFVRLGTADKEWVVLPGGDHAALIERAAPRFVQAIATFLERPRTAR